MIGYCTSAGIKGLEAHPVTVEADIRNSASETFVILGLPEASIREVRVRVKAAMRNCGYRFPEGKAVTVNITPPDRGAGHDLAVALAIMAAQGQVPQDPLRSGIFMGELSLLGRLRPVAGVLAAAQIRKAQRYAGMVVPPENAAEAAIMGGTVFAPATLADVVEALTQSKELPAGRTPEPPPGTEYKDADFAEVGGQYQARRGLEIAAAGGHNILLWGEPGAGKTMLARRLTSILPPMTDEERIEITNIYSIAGLLPPGAGLLDRRPFRAPHHTASEAAIVGGGVGARPGEVTLAHNGVLFLDELPEFRRSVIEALTLPLRSGAVPMHRKGERFSYPAKFVLVGAMNPCPCGYLGSRTRPCRCGDAEIRRYRERIRPLMGELDIVVPVPSISYKDLKVGADGAAEGSASIRARVIGAQTTIIGAPDKSAERLIGRCQDRMALSADQMQRSWKVAATIAKLGGAKEIRAEHLAEALSYRGHDILTEQWDQPTPQEEVNLQDTVEGGR